MRIYDNVAQRAARARVAPSHAAPRVGVAATRSPAHILQLQRTAGNAAVANLLQRELEGEDPAGDVLRPESRSLIYGLSSARKFTSTRLQHEGEEFERKTGQELTFYRTIDAYNTNAGITDAFGAMEQSGAHVIFAVRAALAEADPVATWYKHLDAREDPAKDDDLAAWITCLKSSEEYIGLRDLAVPERLAKEGKHRFGKNLKGQSHAEATALTPASISGWLSNDWSEAEAKKHLATLDPQTQDDLGKWIQTAFFRRTSKLGIDFIIKRGHKIHFNMAADPDFVADAGEHANVRAGGLQTVLEQKREYARPITASELNYAQRHAPPGQLNYFSEWGPPGEAGAGGRLPAGAGASPAAKIDSKQKKGWRRRLRWPFG